MQYISAYRGIYIRPTKLALRTPPIQYSKRGVVPYRRGEGTVLLLSMLLLLRVLRDVRTEERRAEEAVRLPPPVDSEPDR
jgi:hypothetical protein